MCGEGEGEGEGEREPLLMKSSGEGLWVLGEAV